MAKLWGFIKRNKGKVAAFMTALGAAIGGSITWWDAIQKTAKVWGLLLVLLSLMMASAACSSKADNTITTTYKPDGSKVVVQEFSNEGQFFDRQAYAIASRKPVAELIAQDGETIVLQGVKEFRVWGFDPQRGKIDQYENQWVKLLREWAPVLTGGATSVLVPYLSGQAYASVLEAAGGLVGPGITNSFNSSYSPNSNATYAPYGRPSYTYTDDHSTTTTTTTTRDSHNDNSSNQDGE